MGVLLRGVFTVIVLAVWGWLEGFTSMVSPLITGPAATWQLQNSDSAYIMSQYGMRFSHLMNGAIDFVAFAIIIAIWWSVFRSKKGAAAIVAGLMVLGLSSPSWAYYGSQDYTEIQMILPNESAFLVPDVGANKESQAQFGSIDYLRTNKVAMKRVQIPHMRLENSGWFANQVVPSARLVVVDRQPYQREWSKEVHKGTNQKDEGFRCESLDSIGVTTAVTIAAYVTEEDAPQFLYHFGVNPPEGKRDDPQTIFASVLYGRSLSQVMDTNVRGKVHAALCNEMGKMTLDTLFAKKSEIMANVDKAVRETYKPMGISLEYIGFSDELTYDPSIQAAINRVYVTNKEAAAALNLQPALPVLQQEADMEIKKGLANGLSTKGLPNLPSFMLLNRDIFDMVGSWFKSDASPASMPAKH